MLIAVFVLCELHLRDAPGLVRTGLKGSLEVQ